MKTEVTADLETVVQFLASQSYPFDWTPSRLADCTVVAIQADGETAGYIWGEWHPFEATIEFHACVAPRFAGRWHHVLTECYRLAASMGATTLICSPVGGNEGRLARLLERLGFHSTGRSFFRTIEEFKQHGLLSPEARRGPAAARGD